MSKDQILWWCVNLRFRTDLLYGLGWGRFRNLHSDPRHPRKTILASCSFMFLRRKIDEPTTYRLPIRRERGVCGNSSKLNCTSQIGHAACSVRVASTCPICEIGHYSCFCVCLEL